MSGSRDLMRRLVGFYTLKMLNYAIITLLKSRNSVKFLFIDHDNYASLSSSMDVNTSGWLVSSGVGREFMRYERRSFMPSLSETDYIELGENLLIKVS
jgi:hypothetical protein